MLHLHLIYQLATSETVSADGKPRKSVSVSLRLVSLPSNKQHSEQRLQLSLLVFFLIRKTNASSRRTSYICLMRRTTDAELTGEHNLGTSTQGQRNAMDKSKGAI